MAFLHGNDGGDDSGENKDDSHDDAIRTLNLPLHVLAASCTVSILFFINKCIYVYLLIAPRLGLILCLLSVQSNLFAVALFISHFCLLFLS